MLPEIVVVGASLGGISALETLLRGLPSGFPLPVVIVQHRSPQSDETLALVLQIHSSLPVREPDDKDAIEPGRVYIAPADYHLLVDRGSFALSLERKVCYARPSVDVLFESAAHSYGSGVIGIVLTGAGRDGSDGLATIKAKGGVAVVQSPEGAECPAMPEAAIAATDVDRVLPLRGIAAFLCERCPESGLPRKEA